MTAASSTARYRLAPPRATDPPPELDEHQQRVVDHPGGPLLVLAGPGTGKTTTMVEAIVDRIERRGVDPDSVLALTFSRKAAEQLRDRVTSRLGRTLSSGLSSTFHSFAYGLVRRYAPAELYAAPLRLLSAPEQDVVLQELLTHAPESIRWPEPLRAAVGTRGFAREVQAVIARARERGLDPGQLVALGRDEGVPEFEAAGLFLEQYLDVLGGQSAIDYPDLITRGVIEARVHQAELRASYSCVFVDEYQDTDPSQVALLEAIAGDGRDLVAVGDPDQSIYGFRGADVRGILEFPRQFPTAAGEEAPVHALGTTRRFGSRLLRASRSIAAGISMRGAIPRSTYDAFRHPEPAASEFGPGTIEVLTFDTARAEVEHIADLLRRAHLEDGVGWGEMAVLVRSGRTSIPVLRRALTAAGVPVEVAGDETPLVREPAVAVLLSALELLVSDDVPRDRIEELLISPLGGLDATEVRALTRALRAVHPEVGPRELVRRAVLDPALLDGVEGQPASRTRALAQLLERARAGIGEGASAEQVLWTLWSGTSWGERLRAASLRGGQAARLAHRDLDALCALFETAARSEEQRDHTSVATYLATLTAQEIPADTLAERGVRGESVRLLTAHRAKGQEWRLVVVTRVQEGSWPDLRRRDTLLGADRIGPVEHGGLLPPLTRAAMLAEERRLFYVAVTRPRQRLVVTSVQSPDDDGEQPSRFLAELGHEVQHRVGRPRRPLSMQGLVAELRRTVADPERPPHLREAAAARLRLLATTEVHGRPVAPFADPATWWGLRSPSRSLRSVRPEDVPVTLSASALEGLLTCPAQWFLTREAGGSVVSTASQGFGKVVHALAERVAKDEIDATSVDDLMPYVDEVWERMEFRTPWSRAREREAVQQVLARFLAWHHRPGARTVIALEPRLRAEVTLPDGQVVALHGYADRLELDEQDRVVVVDLKTGKYPPSDKSLPEHPQLGLYQLAVDHGAADELVGRPVTAGGAELVQLRHGDAQPKVQQQPPSPPQIEGQLQQALAAVRSEAFVARPGAHCERCPFDPICPAHASGSVLS
ncbi:ATP-dependent DNA helicase [Nocardioides sp. HM23]|uniref:ATP-dependent helicase n=1 Tax=Nocardioides bizhenqiangii TaxID=3095076 RepID=UPI002ACAB1C6|nr:ATP-dependent DNA helicase [Nocardioides sp. HM23]MDZ5621166.1 ATP-dependent DNA helicase [Nocardioides sp. HM23]